jgi:single-stranded DNA-binding protein
MTVLVLVGGTLSRAPEQRMSKAGKPYVATKIKATSGGELQFWSVAAFSETAQAESLRLDAGDGVAVQGPVKVEQYERDGETRLSFSVIADSVMALRQPPRQREKKDSSPVSPTQQGRPAARAFADDVPF